MALVPRCENCTNYKPLNHTKGQCTHSAHQNNALTKERKRHDKCVNSQYYSAKA